jgi:polyisoprenoid-binding protein YceI
MTSTLEQFEGLKAGTWTIDASHSEVGFTVRHLMSKVRGQFRTFEGSLTVGENPLESSVKATIDLSSVDTRNEQRDGHLRSNDFLALDEHPEISFVSTRVAQTGATSLELTGDLTIKGVTNTITVPFEFEGAATDPFGNLRVGFEGSVVINRKDYGVSWNAALEAGGVLVSEKVTLEFEVSAIKSN